MASSIRSLIWACVASVLAVCVATAIPPLALANVFTKLLGGIDDVGRAGVHGAVRTAEELASVAIRAAQTRGVPNASVLVAEGQTVKLVIKTQTETIAKAVRSAGDVTEALREAGITTLYIPEEFLALVKPLLTSMPDVKNIRLLRTDSTVLKLEQSASGRLMAQVDDSNLFVELHSIRDIDTYSAIAHTRVSRSQIEVYSLFDPREIDVLRHLDRGAGDAHHALKPAEAATLPSDIVKRSSNKLTMIVGHVEETSLVMRGTGGEVLAKVSIPELEASVAQAGRNVLVLGCESACVASSGYLSPVNVKAVGEALSVVRYGGTHGQLLTALSKASPDGLVVTASFLNEARLFVLARVTRQQAGLTNQATFNHVRIAAAVPGAWMQPFSAALTGFSWVLKVLGGIWLVGLMNCLFQLKASWQVWVDQSTQVGDSYAGSFKRGLLHARKLVVFLLVFPFLTAAEIAYLLLLACIALMSTVGLIFAGGPKLLLAALAGYVLVLLAWRRLLGTRPLLETFVSSEPLGPSLSGWRDYLMLFAMTIGAPLLLGVTTIELIFAHLSELARWAPVLAAIPISILSFVLLLRACRQTGIGPYELPMVAVVSVYQWLRWSRDPRTLKPVWLACVEAWRER